MIAKLIVHAATRAQAAAALATACRAVQVWPVRTNAGFLVRALSHSDFIAGRVDTGFIDARLDALAPPDRPSPAVLQAAARRRLAVSGAAPVGFRLNAEPRLEVRLAYAGETQLVTLQPGLDRAKLAVFERDGEIVVFENGEAFAFRDPAAQAESGTNKGNGAVISPMPGQVVAVAVAVGERVAKGAPLVVVEAMKTELSLSAPFAGTVAELSARVGQLVTEGWMLVRLEPEDAGHGR